MIGFKEGYEKKGQVYVSSFGEKNGVHTYRVNGLKDDLLHIIDCVYSLGGKFANPPKLEKAYPPTLYSVLLEINILPVGVSHANNQNANEQATC